MSTELALLIVGSFGGFALLLIAGIAGYRLIVWLYRTWRRRMLEASE